MPSPSSSSPHPLWSAYRDMLLIRRFEQQAGRLYATGKISGFCHLYLGQEAVVVGIQHAVAPQDQIITGYRDHGHMLVCGMDAGRVMAELMGRRDGYSGGKGGSMHMFSRETNFFGGHGIVGAQVPLGTGLAFANAYNKKDAVSVVSFGDGAANQGQVYESFNMAKLWNLPVLYVVENNQYAMGTSIERATAQTALHRRGDSFDIKGERVDGMDVEKVMKAAAKALKHCRGGGGPFILEMHTYRYAGHSMSDPAKYRSKEEVREMREHHDPIDHLAEKLLKSPKISEEMMDALDNEIRELMDEAIRFAEASPEPPMEDLMTDILTPDAQAGGRV